MFYKFYFRFCFLFCSQTYDVLGFLVRGGQEIEFQDIETIVYKIVLDIEKAQGSQEGHYFRVFFSNLTSLT